METIKSIVFVQISLVHYQYPRLQALSEKCQEAGVTFTNIELTSFFNEYPWLTGNEQTRFTNITLFPGQSLEKVDQNLLWPALQGALEKLNPDVIFYFGYSLKIMRRMKTWADKRNITSVLMSDSNRFDRTRYLPFEMLKRLFVSRYDGAFVGGTSSSQYIQSLGIPASRITYGLDVIDTTFFEERSSENRSHIHEVRQRWNLPDRYFLFVGRLIAEKNLPMLLAAYQKYVLAKEQAASPWDMVLCGGGSQESELKQIIQNMPDRVREKIHLRGHINQPEIIDFFSCASCFVLPSVSESWGLVINEALSCGLPVIVSSKAGCARDLVIQGENGWVFDPENLDELVRLMDCITDFDEPVRAAMGQKGRELISDWKLDRFTRGAIEIAGIAHAHRDGNQKNNLLSR